VYFLCLDQENNRNSAKQRVIPLFSQSPNRRWPRISAENAMSFADNFIQKQQKQQNNRNYPQGRFADLVNASKR
jgi:hypothetical protein